MMYYLAAMTATIILCLYHTTTYPLANGAEAKCFPGAGTAFLVLLPLTVLAAFRWNVGVDSLYGGSYWQAYHAAADGLNSRGFELGFYWLMRLFAGAEVPFYWFLFALSILFMVCVSIALSQGSVWSTWSVLLFFLLFVYFDCYSSLRQSLAEAVCLIAWAKMGYDTPSRKKDIHILLLFFAAGFFHSIAWMNLPVYLICRIRFSRSGMLKFLLTALLLSPVLQIVLRFAMELLASGQYSYRGVARINAVMTGVLAIICWYFYDEISQLDENAYMYVNQAVCIFVLILNSGAMFLPFRVFDMLKIGYIFIIPYLLRGIPGSRIRMYVGMGLICIFGAWFWNQFFLQNSFAASYQTVFENWHTIIRLP